MYMHTDFKDHCISMQIFALSDLNVCFYSIGIQNLRKHEAIDTGQNHCRIPHPTAT